MKSGIVAEGRSLLLGNEHFQSRLHALREAIQREHAGELDNAGFLLRILIRRRIAREFKRKRTAIDPSLGSLFIR